VSARVFLDANILVSAAWRPENGLLALWTLTDVELLTSAYAIVEPNRNIRTPERRTRLYRLTSPLRSSMNLKVACCPRTSDCEERAVPARGDRGRRRIPADRRKDHFDVYLGTSIEGVLVLRPADYLNARRPEQASLKDSTD
jgi:hypothetical protein